MALIAYVRTETVLIETYWNVKLHKIHTESAGPYVLIETYWNVKVSYVLVTVEISCINRNILECKVRKRRIQNRRR